jgi:hypothetical protein
MVSILQSKDINWWVWWKNKTKPIGAYKKCITLVKKKKKKKPKNRDLKWKDEKIFQANEAQKIKQE